MSIFTEVESEYACEHPRQEIRLKYDSLNRPQYLRQCLTCGQATTTAIKKSTIPNVEKIQTWDYILQESWQHSKQERYDDLKTQASQKSGEFWDRYNEYLQSPEWKLKRLKVLERDNYLCQACLENQATQVHHKSYQHVFNEPLFDLIAVCTECHNRLHS